MGRILVRYVLREVSLPFCLSLLIFTCILLAARILKLVDLLINRGVSVVHIGKMLLFVLPSFLEMTVPMAFLLAVLWGCGRLSTDREVVALKSCGIGLPQTALPVAALAAILIGSSFFLTLTVRPWSNAGLDRVFYDISRTRVTAGLKEKIFHDEFEGLVIYTEEITSPGTRLAGVMIADSRTPQRRDTIFAQSGRILPGEDGTLTLRLNEGTVHSARQTEADRQITHFSAYDITLDTIALLPNGDKPTHSPKDMTTSELLTILRRGAEDGGRYDKARVEFHRRLALPFACLVFGLVALPLSVRGVATSRTVGFTVSLGIILLYYMLLSAGESFGRSGQMPPGVALWMPNVILGGVGVWLFARVTQEKSLFPLKAEMSRCLPTRPAFSWTSTR